MSDSIKQLSDSLWLATRQAGPPTLFASEDQARNFIENEFSAATTADELFKALLADLPMAKIPTAALFDPRAS